MNDNFFDKRRAGLVRFIERMEKTGMAGSRRHRRALAHLKNLGEVESIGKEAAINDYPGIEERNYHGFKYHMLPGNHLPLFEHGLLPFDYWLSKHLPSWMVSTPRVDEDTKALAEARNNLAHFYVDGRNKIGAVTKKVVDKAGEYPVTALALGVGIPAVAALGLYYANKKKQEAEIKDASEGIV